MMNLNVYGMLNSAIFVDREGPSRSIRRVKWRHSSLWSQYDLCVVGQHGVLWEVKWWRFVALFE